MTQHDRRKQDGVAIVTLRPDIKHRCIDAGLPARALRVQPGPSWPEEYRPPVVLDTVGLPVEHLVILLANPPRVVTGTDQPSPSPLKPQPATKQKEQKERTGPLMPLIALADPDDWRTLRLLALCPSIYLICPDKPFMLHRWVRHFSGVVSARSREVSKGWLVALPPDLRLDPLLLPILAALLVSESHGEAAERCDLSDSTLARVLRKTRPILGLPPGDGARFRPRALAMVMLERLAVDSPLRSRHIGGVRDVPTMVPRSPMADR